MSDEIEALIRDKAAAEDKADFEEGDDEPLDIRLLSMGDEDEDSGEDLGLDDPE